MENHTQANNSMKLTVLTTDPTTDHNTDGTQRADSPPRNIIAPPRSILLKFLTIQPCQLCLMLDTGLTRNERITANICNTKQPLAAYSKVVSSYSLL